MSLFYGHWDSPRKETLKSLILHWFLAKIGFNEKIYIARDSPCAKRKVPIFDGNFLVIVSES